MQKITSRDNQRLKFARTVRDGRQAGFIFVEGVRLVEEYLKSELKIADCFFSEEFLSNERNKKLFAQISGKTENLFEIPSAIFDSLSDTKNPQGLIIIGEKPQTDFNTIDISSNEFKAFPFAIYLKELNNPNNLGAILRTCEAVGVSNVIISKNSADVFSPKSLRAAMGAAFRLRFWTEADFETVLNWAKTNNLTTICADVNSEKNLWEIEWQKPRLIIFGSEAHGLTEAERKLIDEDLIILMENNVESLNLAVSGAIILYEAKRNWI
ncbi:MAG: RNA methyltransferase [Pyrinomonadaceae bacterium]